jgi:hypothetical protein
MHSTISVQQDTVRKEQRTRNIVDWGTLFLVVLVGAWIFSTPLRNQSRIMGFVEDDFYYYLKVAQNVASGLGSTFNGITRTNGYHPLYFVVLVFLCKITTSLVGIFRGLWVIWVLAVAATFLGARRLLDRPGSGPFLTNALAVAFLVPCVHLFCEGMEVTLTLPLGIALLGVFRSRLENWMFWHSAGAGLLAALTILSRLDSIFLVLLVLIFTLATPEQRRGVGPRQIAGFAIGGGPLLFAYFLFNHFYFHTWMPISGSAKQLKLTPWPTLTGIRSGGLYIDFLLVFLVYAAIAFWLTRKKLRPEERSVLLAASAFPFLQIGVLAFLSDWPLWGWYFYTVRFAILAALVLLVAIPGSAWVSRQAVWLKAGAYVIALALLLRAHYKAVPSMEMIYDVAVQLHAFEQSHPGVYAMGGGAGMAGWILKAPLVQTEGLMMDPGYLLHVRHQDNLVTTLRTYGVRYYVTSESSDPGGFSQQRDGKCFLADEPYETGHAAPHIRARFCDPPVADIVTGPVVNHIFDLSQQ